MTNSALSIGIIGCVSRQQSRKTKADPILFSQQAVDVALEALGEIADDPASLGEHIGASTVGELVIHRFLSQAPGYKGWEWIAALASVPGSGAITVNEVGLQAGKKATRAPEWIPYEDRVRPGDLGPGDTLPPRADDERLTSWKDLGNNGGFPRNPSAPQTLSQQGLNEALQRWRTGDFGPNSEFAELAPMMCRTCAFYLPFGNEESNFGVCSNEFSADGRVVHATYGCGAHAETKDDTEIASTRAYGAFDDEGIQRFS